MEFLSITFPDQMSEITRLCAEDETFAEICRDYETLMRMLPLDVTNPELEPIHESLAGLETEIRSYLKHPIESVAP